MDSGGWAMPVELFQRLDERNLIPSPLWYYPEPFTRRQAGPRPNLPNCNIYAMLILLSTRVDP
eukprot:4032408-Alexandrium_andersonii.AAC.1